MTRPKYSDADGLLNLPRDDFTAPGGWIFQGNWFIDPDPSLMFAADAGRHLFKEEVYEQQGRLPGSTWVHPPKTWTDAHNDPATSRDEIGLPDGWEWRDLWEARYPTGQR
ncbi:Dysferlin [Chionoecetes opilio]|uniref:Dysferlin n=1 Tax=Chionoecetes opilio TaxID=41210 RepID=A0A8J4Y6U9_CHIOP|nr:Dysferlin [Chionoecetes opilio]